MKEVLVFKLPFYQKGGTISKITKVIDSDNQIDHYKRYEYDPTGIEKEPLTNPKNRFSDIKKEYYANLREYILNKSEEFDRNKNIKKPCSKIEIASIVTIAAICAILIYLSLNVIGGAWMFVIVTIGLGASSYWAISDIKKLNNYNDTKKFLKEYSEIGQELNEYNIEQDKIKQKVKPANKPSTITKERNNGNTITKTRVLEM